MNNQDFESRLLALESKVEELTSKLDSYLRPKILATPPKLSSREVAEALNVKISRIQRAAGKFGSLKALAQKENERLYWSRRDFENWQREQNKTIEQRAIEAEAKARPVKRKGLIRR